MNVKTAEKKFRLTLFQILSKTENELKLKNIKIGYRTDAVIM